jgi:hypothetical protein
MRALCAFSLLILGLSSNANAAAGVSFSVGVPYLLNLGIELYPSGHWSYALGGGAIEGRSTSSSQDSNVSAKLWNADVRARYHLFKFPLFIGLGVGRESIAGQITQTFITSDGTSVPVSFTEKIQSNYAFPHVGLLFKFTWLIIGFEVGAHVPLMSKTSHYSGSTSSSYEAHRAEIESSAAYKSARSKVDDVTDVFGKRLTPYVTLARIGFVF